MKIIYVLDQEHFLFQQLIILFGFTHSIILTSLVLHGIEIFQSKYLDGFSIR